MIVLVTLPFLGHYTWTKRMVQKLIKMEKRFVMIVLTWKDFPIPEENNCIVEGNRVLLSTETPICDTDPTEFNWKRAVQLLPALTETIRNFSISIDAVIYDFFCVEAYFAAKLLRLRSICCIPAIPGEFSNYKRCDAMTEFESVELSGVSDFLMINDKKETKWLCCSPILKPKTSYLGNCVHYVDFNNPNTSVTSSFVDLYVCLGTVVTGNLFTNASNVFKENLIQLYDEICKFATARNLSMIICIPGKAAFEEITKALSASHLHFFEQYVDQQGILTNCGVFITHGGGNSVTEALNAGVPMLCIPFFGDQWASSTLINANKYGIGFTKNDNDLETTEACLANIDLFRQKIAFLKKNIPLLITNRAEFATNIGYETSLITKQYLYWFENALSYELYHHSSMQWKDGDLLFGASKDRKVFCSGNVREAQNFCYESYFIPTVGGLLYPPLIDHYNDVCYGNSSFKGKPVVFNEKLFDDYKNAQPQELMGKEIATMTREQVAASCCAAIDFFCNYKKFVEDQNVIHFIIGKEFFENKDSVAHEELRHMMSLDQRCISPFLKNRVIFYHFDVDQEQPLVRVDLNQVFLFDWSVSNINNRIAQQAFVFPSLIQWFQTFLKNNAPKLGGATLEHRVKTSDSILKNFRSNRFNTTDILGIRIVHPFTDALFIMASKIEKEFRVLLKQVSERGRVIHILFEADGQMVELQLWPSILHSCFLAEHDTVYKADHSLDRLEIAKSRLVRELEHVVQHILDSNGPIIKEYTPTELLGYVD